jgi:eukaryotic-like serine/threonine-protein kinase
MNPERIGRYEILRPLGRGAMGIVYLARDPQIERELALKTIRFDTSDKGFNAEEAKARFLKEARISGRLQHPYIVTVFDVGDDSGTLFLAMEFVQGGSFSQKLAEPNEFPIFERIRVVAEVAEALGHAHERGVLHRDVKPANILLTPAMSAKVTDFGIGKLLSGDTDLTTTGQMVGSPAYMSPEQIRGEKLDARSDIFSLGVVLYQALTLRKPFPADTLTTLVYQILNEEPTDPVVLQGDLPTEISTIIKKCLAKSRADRYSDATEMATDLRNVLGYSPVMSTMGMINESRPPRVATRPGLRSSGSHPLPSGSHELTTAAPPSPPAGPPSSADSGPPSDESPTITAGRMMGGFAAAPQSTGTARGLAPWTKNKTPLMALGAFLLIGVILTAVRAANKKKTPGGEPEAVVTVAAATTGSAGGGSAATTSGATAAGAAPGTVTPAGNTTPVPVPTESIKVVETPVATPVPSPAPTKKPKVKPSPAAATGAAGSSSLKPEPSPTRRPANLTYAVKRFVKINVTPTQARVFLDGKYIGISDDWDDAGGGSLLTFNFEGNHRIRVSYPGYKDLLIDISVRSSAADERVTIDRELEKGTPEGWTGPEGTFRRPHYRTVGSVVFNVEPPETTVTVNGKLLGPASNWSTSGKDELVFQDMAVYDVILNAPGYEPKPLRVLVAPTAGETRVPIKERLKKLK